MAIWGEETCGAGAMLTTCGKLGDMVDVITYAIFGECRLRGVGVVRGVTLPSPIDLRCRPYNTGHTPCDRVMMPSNCDKQLYSCKKGKTFSDSDPNLNSPCFWDPKRVCRVS